MLLINNSTITYIFCSSNTVTGGPEALHQLCDKINSNGGKAKMVYVDYGIEEINKNAKTPIRYRHYNIKISNTVADDEKNVLIVPELWPHLLNNYQHIQKCIWWLSVNYGRENFSLSFSDNRIYHLYQSWYARDFLSNRGVENIYPLFDYLSIHPSGTYKNKERIVMYNPKKGLETTLKIIECCAGCNIEFRALKDLTRPELIKLMKKSMLYIDFGEHPGKDRIPREAAIYNNAVITSQSGSAAFFDDLPIGANYKFPGDDPEKIKDAILFTLDNFGNTINDFNYYKRVISNQEAEFTIQAINLFCPVINTRDISLSSMTGIKKVKKLFNDHFEQVTNKLRKNMPASFKAKLKRIGFH